MKNIDLCHLGRGELVDLAIELRAENARMQSIIDEAKPKVYVDCNAKPGGDGSFEKPFNNVYEEIPAQQSCDQALQLLAESRENFEKKFGFSDHADWAYKDLAELFISDLPEQQSPAVGISKMESATQSPAVAVDDDIQYLIDRVRKWGIENTGNEPSVSCFHRALDELVEALMQSPRITEQYARAAIKETFLAHGFTIKEGQTDLKPYVYDAALALLNKLNEANHDN